MTTESVAVVSSQQRQARARRTFPWLPLLILGAVCVAFVAMLGEIVLRIGELRTSNLAGLRCVGTQTVLNGQKGLYVLDGVAGYRMRNQACVRLKTTEYDEVLKTNSVGMVGPDLPATKPTDEFRVVVLGDSYTVGGQVPYEQTFPAILEQQLRANGYAHVRVINAGVGGYTTFNEAGLLREHSARLQPDLVIVAAFLGNDVFENVLATAAGYREAPEHPKGVTWGRSALALVDDSNQWFARNGPGHGDNLPPAWDPATGLPEPVGNDTVVGSPPAPPGPPPTVGTRVRGAWDAARSTSLLLGAIFGAPIDRSVTTAPGARPPATQMLQLNVTNFEWTILRERPRTYWLDVAWPLFGRYLSEIKGTAGAAPVVVLAIPELSQFDPAAQTRTMADFRFGADEVDWDRPQRELAAQAAADGLPVLDLLPVFRDRPDAHALYLPLDTHYTALGHRVTGEALAAYLESAGLLTRP